MPYSNVDINAQNIIIKNNWEVGGAGMVFLISAQLVAAAEQVSVSSQQLQVRFWQQCSPTNQHHHYHHLTVSQLANIKHYKSLSLELCIFVHEHLPGWCLTLSSPKCHFGAIFDFLWGQKGSTTAVTM